MKLDKFGKTWAKITGVTFLTCSAYLIGGLYDPWVPNSPIESRIWITAIFLVITVGATALAFFTELEE